MKAMPELAAVRNERLEQQNRYNNKMDYDKLRNMIAQQAPPSQMNGDMATRIINLQSNRSIPQRNRTRSCGIL